MSFGKLFENLREKGIVKSRSTLSNHLKQCKKDGLVAHESRNAPYIITQKGIEWLKLTEPKVVEGYVFEYVKGGDFAGSIIVHIPQNIVQKFNSLYSPSSLENLGRTLHVALNFWLFKEAEPPKSAYGVKIGINAAYGKGNLTMFETPKAGYENIAELTRKGTGKPIV